jgi:uncharacterized BrkB/YihY/UPF0761 family membrane protein
VVVVMMVIYLFLFIYLFILAVLVGFEFSAQIARQATPPDLFCVEYFLSF